MALRWFRALFKLQRWPFTGGSGGAGGGGGLAGARSGLRYRLRRRRPGRPRPGPGRRCSRRGGKLRCRRSSPLLHRVSYLPRAESRVLTVAEPLASLRAQAGPVLPRGTPAPVRGPLGAGEAEAARGQSTRQAPRVSEVSGGCLGPERVREGGGGRGLEVSLSHPHSLWGSWAGNDLKNSLFPLLFFLFLSSFRAAADLLPSPSTVKCVDFSPESFAVFPPPLAATEALHCPGDSVAEASGASEATSRSWRWGWGGEKLRELPAGGGRLSRYLPAHWPPPGEDFWVVSFAFSGFHSLVETFKPLGILKTLRLVEGWLWGLFISAHFPENSTWLWAEARAQRSKKT